MRAYKPFCKNIKYIHRDHIITVGKDALITRFSEVVVNVADFAIPDDWIKRQRLFYKQIAAKDGKSIGRMGEIILNTDGQITGFT